VAGVKAADESCRSTRAVRSLSGTIALSGWLVALTAGLVKVLAVTAGTDNTSVSPSSRSSVVSALQHNNSSVSRLLHGSCRMNGLFS
jgi:hypothetical protein